MNLIRPFDPGVEQASRARICTRSTQLKLIANCASVAGTVRSARTCECIDALVPLNYTDNRSKVPFSTYS